MMTPSRDSGETPYGRACNRRLGAAGESRCGICTQQMRAASPPPWCAGDDHRRRQLGLNRRKRPSWATGRAHSGRPLGAVRQGVQEGDHPRVGRSGEVELEALDAKKDCPGPPGFSAV